MSGTTTKSDKRPSKGFTLGRQGFAKISAVEGINLSGEMQAHFESFEKLGLAPDERRRKIVRRYGGIR
jgi:hypothetical protein